MRARASNASAVFSAFAYRIGTDDGDRRDAAPAILVCRRDLVLRRRRIALRARDAHAVVAHLLQLHLREIRDHVRKDVGGRIADLVQHLLGDRRRHDQPAGLRRLPQHEAAVDFARRDRIADILPAGHLVPIGMHAAGRLRAAFEDVTDQAAGGEPVVIVGLPAEFVHQDAERERAVGAAPGDHDVGAAIERGRDRQRAEIGIGGEQLRRQRLAGRSLAARSRASHRCAASRRRLPPPRSSATAQARAQTASSARLAACGLTPPPLLTTLMRRFAISGSEGFR